MKIIQGDTCEEKFASLEKILVNFQKRLTTKVIGFTPPVPICCSKFVPEKNGNILQMLLPFAGTIPVAMIYIGNYKSKNPILSVMCSSNKTSSSVKVELKETVQKFTLNWQLDEASLLEVFIFPPDSIEDIHLAMAIYPTMNDMKKEAFLIEEMKSMSEEELKDMFNARI